MIKKEEIKEALEIIEMGIEGELVVLLNMEEEEKDRKRYKALVLAETLLKKELKNCLGHK